MTVRAITRLAVGLSIAAAIGAPAGCRAQAADVGLGQEIAASRIVRVLSHVGDAGITECLGFLYSSDWVLTAAHCVRGGGRVEVVTLSAARSDVTRVENHPALDVSALRIQAFARFDAAAIAPPSAHQRAAVIVSKLERHDSAAELRQGRGVPYHWTPEAVRVRSDSRPCRGDSGGPLLTADAAIVGVLSRGSISCDGRDEYVVLSPLAVWLRRITTAIAGACQSRTQPGMCLTDLGAGLRIGSIAYSEHAPQQVDRLTRPAGIDERRTDAQPAGSNRIARNTLRAGSG